MTDKTENATPYKLQKAKEQGQVSKSLELTTSLFMLVLLGVAMVFWPSFLYQFKTMITQLLLISDQISFNVDTIKELQQLLWS